MIELKKLVSEYLSENNKKTDKSPPGLYLLRREDEGAFEAVVYNPVVCLILQGSKITEANGQRVELSEGDALLVSHDLPVSSTITGASPQRPYLALVVSLDLSIVRGLYEQVGEVLQSEDRGQALTKSRVDDAWLDPVVRYTKLLENPVDTEVLGAQVLREIHYRLLMSPMGAMLRKLMTVDSHASRISKSILRIRQNFREPLAVADLAKDAGMSPSTFHGHFKSITGTSPLQYQKELRMIEARQLLLGGRESVSTASFSVGYESPTQFSREYTRKFGWPPSKDLGSQAA